MFFICRWTSDQSKNVNNCQKRKTTNSFETKWTKIKKKTAWIRNYTVNRYTSTTTTKERNENKKETIKRRQKRLSENRNEKQKLKMPSVILDRIPLPNLRLYTSVSVLLVSCCVYYAISSTSDPFWRFDNNATASDSFFSLSPDAIIAGLDSSGIDLEKILDVNHGASGESGLKDAVDETQAQESSVLQYISPDQRKLFNDTRTIGSKVKDVVSFMVQEPICIWVSTFCPMPHPIQFIYLNWRVVSCIVNCDWLSRVFAFTVKWTRTWARVVLYAHGSEHMN